MRMEPASEHRAGNNPLISYPPLARDDQDRERGHCRNGQPGPSGKCDAYSQDEQASKYGIAIGPPPESSERPLGHYNYVCTRSRSDSPERLPDDPSGDPTRITQV
jgi:hypothetical protein